MCCAGVQPPVLLSTLEGGKATEPAGEGSLAAVWPDLQAHLDAMEAALPPGVDSPPPGAGGKGGARWGQGGAPRRVQLVVGIDEVDRLKGVPLKLHAYRQLLRESPALRGRVLLAQV